MATDTPTIPTLKAFLAEHDALAAKARAAGLAEYADSLADVAHDTLRDELRSAIECAVADAEDAAEGFADRESHSLWLCRAAGVTEAERDAVLAWNDPLAVVPVVLPPTAAELWASQQAAE